jgi:hypothetical protein
VGDHTPKTGTNSYPVIEGKHTKVPVVMLMLPASLYKGDIWEIITPETGTDSHAARAGAHTKLPAVLLMLGVAFSPGHTTPYGASSVEGVMLETSLWRCDVGDGLSSTSCRSKKNFLVHPDTDI